MTGRSPDERTVQALGSDAEIDVSTLEPGQTICGRFVLFSPPRIEGRGWHVSAVDTERRLGIAPHHRLRLEFIPCAPEHFDLLRRALQNPAPGVNRAWLTIPASNGILVAAAPPSTLGQAEATSVDTLRALTRTLEHMHRQGLSGIRFDLDRVAAGPDGLNLVGFAHLHDVQEQTSVTRLEDVRALLDAFARDLPYVERLRDSMLDCAGLIRALSAASPPGTDVELPPEPSFVGRQAELESLMRALGRARSGFAASAIVHGPRGIGKSRLLREFAARLGVEDDRPLVLQASCNDEGPVLARVFRVLAQRLAGRSAAQRDQVRGRISASIGPLTSVLVRFEPTLESIFGRTEDPPRVELDDDYVRHVRIVADALRALGTASAPLVVLLDDIEHVDSGSLAVLKDLLDDPGHFSLLVFGCRGDSGGLGEIELPLRPLDEAELRAFVRYTLGPPTEALVQTLRHHSHGVPWDIWSALQAWGDRGHVYRDGERWAVAPDPESGTVESLLRHRLRQLPSDARWLLQLAAVRGERTEPGWLREVSTFSESRIERALSPLLESRLVLRRGRLLCFAHGEVRDRVLDLTRPTQLRSAHLHVARWLRARPGQTSAAQRAYHEEHSGAADADELVRLHLEGAAELLRVYDLDRARWHFDCALTHATTPADRAAATEGLADVDVLSDRLDDAASKYIDAIAEQPEPARAIAVGSKGSHALYSKSSPELALRVGRCALERAGQKTPRSRLGVLAALPLDAILSAFRPPQASLELRDALCGLYPCLIGPSLVGDPLSVASYVFRARRTARDLPSPRAALSLTFFAGLRGNLGHYDAAEAVLQHAELLATQTDDAWVLGVIHHIRAHVIQLPAGRYEEGQRTLDKAIEHFRRSGNLSVAALSLFFKAAYGRNCEPVDRVLAWLDESTLMARRHGNELGIPGTEGLKLYVMARAGRKVDPGALERLSTLLVSSDKLVPHDRLTAHNFLALAWLELGDVERSGIEIERARPLAPLLPGSPEISEEFYFAQAMLLARRQRNSTRDWWRLRYAILRLLGARARSPRLWAAGMYVSIIRAVQAGAMHVARKRVARLEGALDEHRQVELVARARAVLESPLALTKAPACLPPPLEPATSGAPPQVAPEPSPGRRDTGTTGEATELGPVMDRIRGLAGGLTPGVSFVYVQSDSDIPVCIDARTAEALLIQMLCAARDAISAPKQLVLSARRQFVGEAEAAEAAGARAGEYAAIRVEAGPGPVARFVGGLAACRRLLQKAEGFIETGVGADDNVVLTAFVPLHRAAGDSPALPTEPAGEAVVCHPDARVSATIAHALRELGFSCSEAPGPAEPMLTTERLVFVEEDRAESMRAKWPDRYVVAISSRKASSSVIEPVLRVPFATEELSRLVDRAAAHPTDKEQPTG